MYSVSGSSWRFSFRVTCGLWTVRYRSLLNAKMLRRKLLVPFVYVCQCFSAELVARFCAFRCICLFALWCDHFHRATANAYAQYIRPSVCLSVCQSRGLSQNEWNLYVHFYTTWKVIHPSFLTVKIVEIVGGGDLFCLKFWSKLTRVRYIRFVAEYPLPVIFWPKLIHAAVARSLRDSWASC